MLLWCSAAKQRFNDPRWLSCKQAQAPGAQVRKGERGTMAIFYKMHGYPYSDKIDQTAGRTRRLTFS
ncbi:hypothetical protein AYY17_02510 [Morganella psychrotolerans]|uniref:N-terminal domain-containing protein n=1 Tax=Morganella psychrotolerans TaxID=368603 RepID=A0A1B8HQS4_9GAMM|nr:hypothetical protein AYY17_02510 [Morganella psychrotolerans]